MKIIIGIDVGGSTTKFIACTRNKEVIKTLQVSSSSINGSIPFQMENFVQKCGKKLDDVEKVVLTGVGASFLNEDMFHIPVVKVSEFEAIGLGGLYTSFCEEALVVSMGTGTALVQANFEKRVHIGGVGLGGGTLIGLGQLLLDENQLFRISELAETGDLKNIDLLVADICCDNIITLPLSLTASNFGKIKESASQNDIALGLINMLFQAIAKIAMFACLNTNINNIVLTGSLANIKQTKEIFEPMGKIYDLNFIVPDNCVFATVFGAVISQIDKE